ncbi:flippase [Halosolutus gelatinilyticus]|uniref:flippase n=1 Tax=Halosolutus gelatinilyticus TaxID=2931975 RepID=UPI001FF5896F|nr:flippase [Halosolutus gelatinilyticus]
MTQVSEREPAEEHDPGAESASGDSLRDISGGAALHFGGKAASNGLGFVFNLLMTRTLGATLYGVFTYANTLIEFLMVLARLGTGKSILRFLPANADDPARSNWIIYVAYLTALGSSIVIGTVLYVFAPEINDLTLSDPLLVLVLQVLAIVLPFNTLLNLTNQIFRGLKRLELQVVVADVTQHLVRIFAVAVAFLLGFSLVGAVAAIAIGSILTLAIAVSLLYTKTNIRPLGKRSNGSLKHFYNYSLPLTLKDIGQKLYTRVDILMVGLFLTGSAVGIYRISILLSSFLVLPLQGINQLFPPVASDLNENGQRAELESVYQVITRWTFTIVIPPAIALVMYSHEALRIFGDGFSGGATVLALFALAQLTNCAVGPSGFLLMMTDHQYVNMINQWVLGVSNLILNYVLILQFGFIGVAVATAGSLAVINVVRVIEVWYLEGMTPYSRSYWKPIVAGILTVPVMAAWTFVLSGYPLLFVGAASGLVAFGLLLFAFGIEAEDKEFYADTIEPALAGLRG